MNIDDFRQLVGKMLSGDEGREECEQQYFALAASDPSSFFSNLFEMVESPKTETDTKSAIVLLDNIFSSSNNELITPNLEIIAPIFIPFIQRIWVNPEIMYEYQEFVINLFNKAVFAHMKEIWTDSIAFLMQSAESEDDAIANSSIQIIGAGISIDYYSWEETSEFCMAVLQNELSKEASNRFEAALFMLTGIMIHVKAPEFRMFAPAIVKELPKSEIQQKYLNGITNILFNDREFFDECSDSLVQTLFEMFCNKEVPEQTRNQASDVLERIIKENSDYIESNMECAVTSTISVIQESNEDLLNGEVFPVAKSALNIFSLLVKGFPSIVAQVMEIAVPLLESEEVNVKFSALEMIRICIREAFDEVEIGKEEIIELYVKSLSEESLCRYSVLKLFIGCSYLIRDCHEEIISALTSCLESETEALLVPSYLTAIRSVIKEAGSESINYAEIVSSIISEYFVDDSVLIGECVDMLDALITSVGESFSQAFSMFEPMIDFLLSNENLLYESFTIVNAIYLSCGSEQSRELVQRCIALFSSADKEQIANSDMFIFSRIVARWSKSFPDEFDALIAEFVEFLLAFGQKAVHGKKSNSILEYCYCVNISNTMLICYEESEINDMEECLRSIKVMLKCCPASIVGQFDQLNTILTTKIAHLHACINEAVFKVFKVIVNNQEVASEYGIERLMAFIDAFANPAACCNLKCIMGNCLSTFAKVPSFAPGEELCSCLEFLFGVAEKLLIMEFDQLRVGIFLVKLLNSYTSDMEEQIRNGFIEKACALIPLNPEEPGSINFWTDIGLNYKNDAVPAVVEIATSAIETDDPTMKEVSYRALGKAINSDIVDESTKREISALYIGSLADENLMNEDFNCATELAVIVSVDIGKAYPDIIDETFAQNIMRLLPFCQRDHSVVVFMFELLNQRPDIFGETVVDAVVAVGMYVCDIISDIENENKKDEAQQELVLMKTFIAAVGKEVVDAASQRLDEEEIEAISEHLLQ